MLSSSPKPPMIYDYGGFPPHTYEVRYSAPGSPELAAQVKDLLDAGGFPAQLDAQRGFDHGTFSMYPVYPDADVPIVQLSLKHGLDPLTHLQVGRLLAPLRKEGVLIVGSGLSYHNLRPSTRGRSGLACVRRLAAGRRWPCRRRSAARC
jgi:aromatic ring-opening dioxygenase catalytic subunit (LigB family)